MGFRYLVFVSLLLVLSSIGLANAEHRYIIGLKQAEVSSMAKCADLILSKAGVNGKIVCVCDKLKFVVIETNESIDSLKEKLGNLVKYVEPDYIAKAYYIPNDPYFKYQWNLRNINVTNAWNISLGNKSIIVAIIDTGVDYNHPDLKNNYVPLGYDWVNDDNDPMDDNGHGTHCAGIVAAVINNGIGIAGIANVKIMAEKVLNEYGWGYYSDVARGIVHAVDSGAKIISMSLGGNESSITLENACLYAWSKGALLVAASGNDGANHISYPAAYDTVIAVGSINESNKLSYFSNYGNEQELVAPGEHVLSTYYYNGIHTYIFASGTSMATPHVAGVAALAWATHPTLNNQQIRDLLRATAIDLGAPGWDKYYGYGKVDAYRAVTYTLPPIPELNSATLIIIGFAILILNKFKFN